MKSSYYKRCMVPECISTTIKTPNKLFIHVPTDTKIRKKWLKLAGRDDASSLSTDSAMHLCEDHFDLPNDMVNYMEYHIMGKVSQVRSKPGCIPTKFECREAKNKRKQTSTKQPLAQKKQKRTAAKCLQESENTDPPSSSFKDTKDMKSSYYKHCMVPQCKSTTIKTPNKLFLHVPTNKKIRKKWLKLAGRDDASSLSTDSAMYFCEDHFDLPNDMVNYMEYHIMGKVSQVRTKPGCIPTKFECHEENKRKCSITEQPFVLKIERTDAESPLESEDSCTQTPNSSFKDTSDTSSEFLIDGENVEEIVCEPEQTAYENVQAYVAHKFKSKNCADK